MLNLKKSCLEKHFWIFKIEPKTNRFDFFSSELNQKRMNLVFETQTKPKANEFSFLKPKLNQKQMDLFS